MSKTLLELSEKGPDSTIDLGKNRQYVIPRLAHYSLEYTNYNDTYRSKNEFLNKKYYDLIPCKEELFTEHGTDYERRYYRYYRRHAERFQYCVDEDDANEIYLQGIRDSAIN